MSSSKLTFEMLQRRFVSGLARRLAQLNEEFATLSENETDWMIKADAMLRGFHSLAGIGGTYGFPVITEIARSGEVACAALKSSPASLDLSRLQKILDSLAAAALTATAAVNSQLDQQANAPASETHSNA